MKKRFLAAVLCAVMVLALLPTTAFADADDIDIAAGSVTITTNEYAQGGVTESYTGVAHVSSAGGIALANTLTIDTAGGTVNVTIKDVVFSAGTDPSITVQGGGTANVTLNGGSITKVESNIGIAVEGGSTANINVIGTNDNVSTAAGAALAIKNGSHVNVLSGTLNLSSYAPNGTVDGGGTGTLSVLGTATVVAVNGLNQQPIQNTTVTGAQTTTTSGNTKTTTVTAPGVSNSTLYYNATDGKLHIGSTDGTVVPATSTDIGSDGTTPVYSGSGNTLTLSGVSFTTTALNALVLPADMTLTLEAGTTNTISVGTAANTVRFNPANTSSKVIYSAGALTINGSGTLNAESYTIFNQPDTNGSCIEAAGSCTINAKVNIVGGNATNFYGVKADSITVNDPANVDVNCSSPEDYRYGLYADRIITVNSGTVDISFEEDSSHTRPCYGIRAGNNITILGGSVSAITGNVSQSYGISSGGSMTISGGIVTAAGNSTVGASYGIAASGALNITGGHITASGTHASSAPGVAAVYGDPLTVGSTA